MANFLKCIYRTILSRTTDKVQWNKLAIFIVFILLANSNLFAESANPPSNPPTNPQAMSSKQFQEWLKSNSDMPPFIANSKPTLPIPKETTDESSTSAAMSYEQGQQIMLNTIPARPPSQESTIAFDSMLQQNMPLAPQQVVQLRQQIDLAQRASATSPNIPPKPVSTTLMINLAPGATPPAIRLAQGYVSSLVFVDSTGAPWPIASFDIGSPKSMNIQWDGKSNILLLQAISSYSNGNIVVRLLGMPIPVTLELVAGQPVVDYRVDIHVSGIGPNTKELPIGTMLPNSANQLLLGVLDGIAPAGSKTLTVRGADAQAWLLGDKVYFRTRFTVLSPGWIGTMASPDGMHAYEMQKTSSILVSRYGEPAELKIEGL
ncbi:MAG: hypothetical protein A3F11_08285 [Gammaproteobacteria bacterium RIFCSPHIGHO2_12_FULL_37_14]|nr:MAG: hypothetical protein A3F11_08285 [Gammaproteobacteria bacterium RIFCSPHIGHO2_12_FULL_37_14]